MTTTPLFTQHSRLWESNQFVYPVISRRSHGLSIGVNLNPDKACNFDCIYCSVDRTVPGPAKRVDLAVVERELDGLLDLATSGALWQRGPFANTPTPLRRLNDVALSGDGEPTASPQFGEACRLVARALDARGLASTRIVLITNATLLDRPAVAESLEFLAVHHGEIWAKLDAGTEGFYQAMNRSAVPLDRVVENLRRAGQRQPLVLQSMFLALQGRPPPADEVDAWLGRVAQLRDAGCRLDRVQIYTVARRTAEGDAGSLELASLEAIAGRVRALGLRAEVFGGSRPATAA